MPDSLALGPGAAPRVLGPSLPPKKLQNLQIKISRKSANKSANFFKAVRHRMSGTVVKKLSSNLTYYTQTGCLRQGCQKTFDFLTKKFFGHFFKKASESII